MAAGVLFNRGDVVIMLPPYVGSGQFGHDQWTGGTFTVLSRMLGDSDYKLIRGRWAEVPPASEWEVIAHVSRLEGQA